MASREDFGSGISPLSVFGAMVRRYRLRAGMSQDQVGARLHLSADMVGKIENGQRVATEKITIALDAMPELVTGGALGELRELLGDYLKQRSFPGWFVRWPDKEAEATTLRTFELVVVPGLLQTEGYARTVLRTQVMATDDEIEEMVKARMERQAVLSRDDPPMLWVIMDENALRRPVGGPGIMLGQCEHLIEMAHRPNIVIQVIPLEVGAHQGLSGNFVIADFAHAASAGYQDTAVRGQVIEDSDDLSALTVVWETLKAEALSRSASLGLIEEVAKTWT